MAEFVKYNGQDVVADDSWKSGIEDSVKYINANGGFRGRSDWTAKDYDYALNPNTAGARWGEATTPSNYQLPDLTNGGASTTQPSNGGGGLLNPKPATTSVPTASTYKPTLQTVNDKSLVQNQIAGITSQDSALNQLARTDATKAANSRGLLNSSLAVGAAQRAVLQQALPIAQQDAGVYAATDAANTQYQNSADQFNAGAQNTLNGIAAQGNIQKDLQQMQSATQLSLADKDAANKIILQNIDSDTKVKLANLDAASKTQLQNLVSSNQQLLQTNVSASNIFTQYMTNLANISTSDKLDGPAKQQAADNQLNALNAQLQALGQISGLDLSKYFQKADVAAPSTNTSPTQQPSNPPYQDTQG